MRMNPVGPDACRHTASLSLSAPSPLRSQAPRRSIFLSVQCSAAARGERSPGSESAALPSAGAGARPSDAGSLRAHAGAQPNVVPLATLGKGLSSLRAALGLAVAEQQGPAAAEAAATSQASQAPERRRGGAQPVDPPSWPTAAARQGLYSDVPVERVRRAIDWGPGSMRPRLCSAAALHTGWSAS